MLGLLPGLLLLAGGVSEPPPATGAMAASEDRRVSKPDLPVPRQPSQGVTWRSDDDRFSLTLNLRGQVRYSILDRANQSPRQELTLRRARIKFSGHALREYNQYKLELGLSPRDMGMTSDGPRFTPVLDWTLEFGRFRDAEFRVGQYKLPYGRARMQSSGDLQFVDRSIADGEFNLNRDVGFDLHSYNLLGWGHLRYYLGAYLGEGRDAYQPTNFEVLYLARLEVLPFGQYNDDDHESDLERGRSPRMSVGVAYAFVDGARRDRGPIGSTYEDGGTADTHNATVDLSFKLRGFTAFAEAYLREGRRQPGPSIPATGLSPARTGLGWSAQTGYLLGQIPLEFAARYSETRPFEDSPLPEQRQPTAAIGYYVFGHAIKVQLDYSPTWVRDDRNAPTHTIRLQFQAEL